MISDVLSSGVADSIRVIKDTWTFMRAAAVPLVADLDWRATNDIVKFLAGTELMAIVPKLGAFGGFQMALEWLDADGELVIPASNSRVTLEILELTEIPALFDEGVRAKKLLVKSSDDYTLQGEQIISGVLGTFRQAIGVRLISSQSEPAGAAQLIVVGRYA